MGAIGTGEPQIAPEPSLLRREGGSAALTTSPRPRFSWEARRHNAHVLKCVHVPLEEPVALSVPVEFHLHIEAQRIALAEMVDLA